MPLSRGEQGWIPWWREARETMEGPGPVVRSVVGDHPHEAGRAVGGEEGPAAAEETDRGRGSLVIEGLGVGQAVMSDSLGQCGEGEGSLGC